MARVTLVGFLAVAVALFFVVVVMVGTAMAVTGFVAVVTGLDTGLYNFCVEMVALRS